jgi:hypothetical protein
VSYLKLTIAEMLSNDPVQISSAHTQLKWKRKRERNVIQREWSGTILHKQKNVSTLHTNGYIKSPYNSMEMVMFNHDFLFE